jgi:hypothetical protein
MILPFLAAAMITAPAMADPFSLKVSYSASVSGLPVGKARVEVRFVDGEYTISGSGKVSGISALFTDGKGKASVSGTMLDFETRPVRYNHTIVDDRKVSLDMIFSGDTISEITLLEPSKSNKKKKRKKKKKKSANPSRLIPVTEEHKSNVIDPLSGFLLPASELTGDSVCNRTLNLFDGKQRFDVAMQFDRKVKRDGVGVFVCSVRYLPIAGHKPAKKSIKFMAENKKIEIWLAPVGNSGFVAPVEAHVKTQIGMLVVKAVEFQVGQ